MLKSEMQHQYWITKKIIKSKLGGKEDECIVSSDAELDSKIELFKSIAETCTQLFRVADHYQERLAVLSQEEHDLGKFLKEAGKNSATTGKVLTNSGKSILHCGQQRLSLRAPLLRLHQEMETFRKCAVFDTKETITAMERERTEYRAAMSWMKSASGQLDPDSGKGLDKFRKAQNHVRQSKSKFDRIALDCLQKIDLLAAARCNMFSHALVAYQQSLLQFFKKTTEVFQAASRSLKTEPHYTFSILKELTQVEKVDEVAKEADDGNENERSTNNLIDVQLDDSEPVAGGENNKTLSSELMTELDSLKVDEEETDLLGMSTSEFGDFVSAEQPSYMPSQLLLDDLCGFDFTLPDSKLISDNLEKTSSQPPPPDPISSKSNSKNSILDLFSKIQPKGGGNKDGGGAVGESSKSQTSPPNVNKDKIGRKNMNAWYQLFSELDPLANPDAIDKKIGTSFSNNSHAA